MLLVSTTSSAGIYTNHVLEFADVTFHSPHHAVRQVIPKLPSLIYTGAPLAGSPAQFYGLEGAVFVCKVNGKSVESLSDFKAAMLDVSWQSFIRFNVCYLDGRPDVVSLKHDELFFPAKKFVKNSGGDWEKRSLYPSAETIREHEGGCTNQW